MTNSCSSARIDIVHLQPVFLPKGLEVRSPNSKVKAKGSLLWKHTIWKTSERKWTHATVCCGRRVVGDSTRYNHFMTFFRVEGWAVGQAQAAVPQL